MGYGGVPLAAWAESLKPESMYRSCCLKVLGRLRFRVRFIKVVEGQRFSFILIMCWEVTFCQVIAQGEKNPVYSLLQYHHPPNRGRYFVPFSPRLPASGTHAPKPGIRIQQESYY